MNIEALFEHFKNINVLILGDVMVDEYIWGNATRISPEAPVPIVNVERNEIRLGGAANVALNIKSLAAKAILCGFVGNDYYGKQFYDLLDKENLSHEGVFTLQNRKTTVKTRVIAHHQHLLRIDAEQTDIVPYEAQQKLYAFVQNRIKQADIIIFEDYDKGALDQDFIKKTIQLAKENQVPVVVDPKFRNFLAYQGCTLFKPNLKELKEALHVYPNPRDKDDIKVAIHKVLEAINCENVMITLSEHGVAVGNRETFYYVPAHVRKIADVSGAGDTVISVVALCMALKLPLEYVAELSNLAGGLVCEEVGVVPINAEKLKKESQKLFHIKVE
ncbi:MAG: D-glycero-beta-D-manno-heptose-7-phosphate kinase [Bacteroidia bacterium]|nr:D-glycero-beta-D-manno-heptose-7-phosphate kinase [Bacteroidia bacterium]MDW8345569.1 D-glycero-beta-D-manno-heptose-7-phosphate kinase [Bacteroidia bacterium]